MHTFRTRFKKEIVAEFLPPSRITKKQRVIILLDGAPSVPSKKPVLEFLSKKGFWVFSPRYRGAWESDGKFLKHSLEKDVLDVVSELSTGFTELWNNKKIKLKPDAIYIIGASFGGPASIIASKDPRVTKSISISPMIDWTKTTPAEPIDQMAKFFETGYGNGYRVDSQAWERLKSGKFYNAINHVKEIDGKKLLIIHAKDDKICPYKLSKKFAEDSGSQILSIAKGGHYGSSILLTPRIFKAFQKFIKS